MGQIIECDVEVVAPDKRAARGRVQIQTWDRKERIRRALKGLGLCWFFSIATVIIPLAHFVLVPGFFIAGIIVFFHLNGTESYVVGGESPCPSCGERLPIEKGADRWPLSDLCTKCRKNVTITKLA